MTRFAVRCLLRALTRLILASVLLLITVEAAILLADWQGDRIEGHVIGVSADVFVAEAPANVFAASGEEPVAWWLAVLRSSWASLKGLGLAVLITLAIGPPLGILAARFRRLKLWDFVFSPFFVLACLPGFWAALVAVQWLVEKWGQPGFSDSALAVGGELESWWRIFLVAAILAAGVIGWQIRSVAEGIGRAAGADHVHGSISRGQVGGRLFYRHIFRNAVSSVARSLDRVLPVMLGAQLFVEWAFRYPGLGRLMLESARDGHFTGLFAGGVVMVSVVIFFRFLGELIHGAADRRDRDRIVTGLPA